MTTPTGNGDVPAPDTAAAVVSKPKRVRTGCLTCRERHLKCDEGAPICQNCRKSNRQCKRGLRLNFIDTNCQGPPQKAPTLEWKVDFMDESRDIASEYVGGLEKYGAKDARPSRPSIVQAHLQTTDMTGMPMFEYNPAAVAHAHAQA
ncbi:hypothetical protein KCU94_g7819, partial [Aureobasidium melanogenum]